MPAPPMPTTAEPPEVEMVDVSMCEGGAVSSRKGGLNNFKACRDNFKGRRDKL